MMNLPLLYWAAEELDDPRYFHLAVAHADMALKNFIRPDGSVNHQTDRREGYERGVQEEHEKGEGEDNRRCQDQGDGGVPERLRLCLLAVWGKRGARNETQLFRLWRGM